jgi:hypothetical protein
MRDKRGGEVERDRTGEERETGERRPNEGQKGRGD